MAFGERTMASAPMHPVCTGPLRLVHDLLADRRVRFLLTGSANAIFAFGAFVVFQHALGGRWGYLWAVLATHLVTVLVGFASHRRLVFGVQGRVLQDLWRFELVHLSNLGVNALLLALAVEGAGMTPTLAQGCLIVFSACYSWVGHSRFSFRRSTPHGHE